METFLFNNAPAVIVSGIVAYILINILCAKKDDVATKEDIRGTNNRINCVAEKVAENDKSVAVEMEKQHRTILDDVGGKFASKDTAYEIRNDVSRIEYKFEKLEEKLDTFMEKILDAVSKK